MIKFYHGQQSRTPTLMQSKVAQKVKYWTDCLHTAKMYGKLIDDKYIPYDDFKTFPVFDFGGSEFNQGSAYMHQIEQHLIQGKPLDIWGQYLPIDANTRFVIIENIVDVPDGYLDDVSDEKYDKVWRSHSSTVMIEKL